MNSSSANGSLQLTIEIISLGAVENECYHCAKALLKVAPHYRDTWHTTEYLAKAITREYDLDDGTLTGSLNERIQTTL
jgi:hypothetical protein